VFYFGGSLNSINCDRLIILIQPAGCQMASMPKQSVVAVLKTATE
jgi:hypothetical protein